MKASLLFLIPLFIASCGTSKNQESEHQKKRPVSYLLGKFFEKDGKRLMYGGDSTEHFAIDNLSLKKEQFHYGIGREAFPALLKPRFESIAEADSNWADSSRFLVAYDGDDVKAYSVKDLTRHEVVNDELNGAPIMAAYCILADLGAVYTRKYGDDTLTFALSGYTYYDPEVWNGLDGFVLWDRDTESLWWPLIGKAVSGPLKNVKLIELEREKWADLTWKEVKEQFPTARVMVSGQDYERPTSWRRLSDVSKIIQNYSE